MTDHPIGLVVDDDLRRLTVFFRLLLAIPQAISLGLFAIPVYYEVQTYACAALLTDRYPSLAGGPSA
jgi:hypothetical protein